MLTLKRLRKSKKLTQQEVADRLGVTQATFSGWETEKFEIDNTSLIKLADFFDVSVDVLLGRVTADPVPHLSENHSSEYEELTQKEKQLILDFRSLNPQGQELILQQMFMAKGVYKKDTDVSDVEIVG